VFISLLNKDIQDDDLAPGYFLYGPESFLARKFVEQLKALLLPPDSQPFNLDRFWMDEASWVDVVDAARTAPSFFSPWRLILAEFLQQEEDRQRGRQEDKLSDVEEKELEGYFASPSPRTVIVIIYPYSTWKVKNTPVFQFFARRLKARVVSQELKALKEHNLMSWLDQNLAERKLLLTPEAKAKLMDIVGNDLDRLSSEMDKLVSYAGKKTSLEAEEISQLCGWTRGLESWALSDALALGDLRSCLDVLDGLIKSGEEGIKILNNIIRFFQEILVAKAWLRERSKDRKEIFRTLYPNIKENFFNIYNPKFKSFFALADRLSLKDVRRILNELVRIDRTIKSSDVSARILLESFVFGYCRRLNDSPLRRIGWS
jgi:DNA polymerase III delta subunit